MTTITKRKAWTVMLAGTGINLALGILYTWSVFKGAIQKSIDKGGEGAFDWDIESMNDPYVVCLLVFAFSMILAGKVQDRFGPRVTAFTGGLLVAIGFILISFSTSLAVWILGFGVLAGTGIGFGYSAATPPGLKWFPSWKTGMVAGVVVSGFGLASVYIAPLSNYLLGVWGLQGTMLFFGIAFAVVLSLLSLLLVNPPKGYDPGQLFGTKGQPATPAGTKPAALINVAPGTMLKTGYFWRLWLMYAIGSGAGLMVISSVAGMAKKSMAGSAFVAVALLAIGNAAGRIIAGILSDKIGRAQTLLIMLLFQAVLMFVAIPLVASESTGAFLILALATFIGFNYGTNLSLFPAFNKDAFGLKNFGINYGLLFTAWGVGGFVLSRLSQMFVKDAGDVPGKYTNSFITAGILLVIAAAMTFTVRKRPEIAQEQLAEKEPATAASS